jgi:tetratricopeptide (TPR) repeat protein
MNFQDAVNAQNNGDLKLADKIYKKLLRQQSNNFEVLFNYAVLNFDLKNYIKSEELFKKSIIQNSNNNKIFKCY